MNRRFFLRGLGGAVLSLPTLTSLLPKAAQAQAMTPARRYVQLLNPYGPTPEMFYGGLSGALRPLSGVSGALSPILGTAFDAVRGKLNVLRGVDVLVNNPNHQYCFATCASGYASGLDGDGYPPESGNASVDCVLSESGKVYPTQVAAARKLVNINPLTTDDYSRSRSVSWRYNGNAVQMMSPLKQTSALLDVFMSSFGVAQMPMTDGRELALVQAVGADYRRVRASPKLSAEDKLKLDAYVALIDDLEREARSTMTVAPPVCAGPMTEPGSDNAALVRTQLRILAAAMACDLTRVGSVMLGMSEGYNTRHAEHHATFGTTISGALLADFRAAAGHAAWFMSHLDGIQDVGGTLLDNSIVYWTMQYGSAANGNHHSTVDMPIVVGGGAGGRLATGNFIDYRAQGKGLPINNLLVTFFNAMGLSSADYQKPGATGFGLYTANALNGRNDRAQWLSDAGKRTPLPGLYTGPVMG
ncbi:MAG: DUF1552 domain-containing protein [Myxococcaceae bacterium]|nr:DUF1552 domain-containing protein [Myxococcaceae bacterium]